MHEQDEDNHTSNKDGVEYGSCIDALGVLMGKHTLSEEGHTNRQQVNISLKPEQTMSQIKMNILICIKSTS